MHILLRKEVEMFYRLCLDCRDGKEGALSDRELCERFMDALVKVLDVKEVGRVVCEVGGPAWNGLPPGVSIASLFVESGSQLHTWPEDGKFYLDVTSCKRFSSGPVVALVENWFGAEVEVRFASSEVLDS